MRKHKKTYAKPREKATSAGPTPERSLQSRAASVQAGVLFKKPRISILIFFLIYFFIGLAVYKDYGLSWDEPTNHMNGMVTIKYVASIFMPNFNSPDFSDLPPLADYSEREYGVIFDVPVDIAEMLLGYRADMPEIYYLRHLCTFLVFFVGVFFFYLIVRDRFNSRVMGLAGCLFLVLTPRFFAQSFYNLKDSVFLSLFIVTIYFFIRYLNSKTLFNALLFGLASALMVDLRVTGVFIPFLAILMSGIDVLKEGRPFNNLPKKLNPLFVYLISYFLFTTLFWPYLWENPVQNFLHAFEVMSRYPQPLSLLYRGEFIQSTELPWHYIPVWMLITIPVQYTVLFLIGSFLTIRVVLKNGLNLYSNNRERQDFLFLLLFTVPLTAVIILKSVLYDGWRQMHFIYAPFLLLATIAASKVMDFIWEKSAGARYRIIAIIAASLVIAGVLSTAYQMVRYHPFQNVFFNILVGDNAGMRFTLDYWGLSYRQGLEYIVKNDKRPVINLAANSFPSLSNNFIFLDQEDRARLQITNENQADYFLTEYRWHPEPYTNGHEVFNITLFGGRKIMSVFRLR